jgi:hypothetical protein
MPGGRSSWGTRLMVLSNRGKGYLGSWGTSTPQPATRPPLISMVVDGLSRLFVFMTCGDQGFTGRGPVFVPLANEPQVPCRWRGSRSEVSG